MLEEKLEDENAVAEGDSSSRSSFGGVMDKLSSYMPSISIPAISAQDVQAAYQERMTTPLNEEIFNEAKAMCANEGITGQGPPLDPRVNDLVFGWSTDSKTDRQQGQFFRLSVEEKHVQNGFVLTCRGIRGCKFRCFLFDSEGNMLFQEEGVKTKTSKGNPETSMFFTNFDTHRLDPTATPSDKSIPGVFCKLESYSRSKKHIAPGKYLLCVHGDNIMGKTHFNLLAVPANDSQDTIDMITATDAELVKMKISIDDAKLDFLEKRQMYENLLTKAKEDEKKLDDLLRVRENAYKEFLDNSERAYRSDTVTGNDAGNIHDFYPDQADIDPEAALMGGRDGASSVPAHRRASAMLSGAFVAGADAAAAATTSATATASAASGWISGKLGQLKGSAQRILTGGAKEEQDGDDAAPVVENDAVVPPPVLATADSDFMRMTDISAVVPKENELQPAIDVSTPAASASAAVTEDLLDMGMEESTSSKEEEGSGEQKKDKKGKKGNK